MKKIEFDFDKSMMKFFAFLFMIIVLISMISFFVEAVIPSGAQVTQISNSTGPSDPAGSSQAVAGNVTELNLYGYTSTQSWQGYYGNVTGTIQLSDGGDNVLYNWSDMNPKGEIYASTSNSVSWTDIQCFNFTAKGTFANDSANRGGTSKYGLNLTQLETNFSIPFNSVDSVNNTFNLSGPGNHATFYTNNLEFADGTCQSTRLYTSLGKGVSGDFEEVLLYDPLSRNVVYTSLLNQNILGFDNRTHDFEMVVPEDGHGTNTATTSYYFYVELQ